MGNLIPWAKACVCPRDSVNCKMRTELKHLQSTLVTCRQEKHNWLELLLRIKLTEEKLFFTCQLQSHTLKNYLKTRGLYSSHYFGGTTLDLPANEGHQISKSRNIFLQNEEITQ
jgi:hypothetical protein